MFPINFDVKNATKKIISPEDLLPSSVETTDGKISPFNPERIIESLIRETGLERALAIKVTTNVLRKLSSLGLDFIPAPHLRELVCSELTAMGLHKYRNQYTRLGIPIYDVKRMLQEQGHRESFNGNAGLNFSSLLAAQVIEQYVHLDRLTEDAEVVIETIREYARKLSTQERDIIEKAMENALRLYNQKKAKNLV